MSSPLSSEAPERLYYSNLEVDHHSSLQVDHNRSKEMALADYKYYGCSDTNGNGEQIPPGAGNDKESRIFGLRATTFWLSLALFVMFLFAIGAAAAAGALSKQASSICTVGDSTSLSTTQAAISTSATQTSTVSIATQSTTTAAVAAGATVVYENPTNNCPNYNNTVITTPVSSNFFQVTCGMDFVNGSTSASGDSTVLDLTSVLTASLESCMFACMSYNFHANGIVCGAVSYTANLSEPWVGFTEAQSYPASNCFLKSAAGVGTVASPVAVAVLKAST